MSEGLERPRDAEPGDGGVDPAASDVSAQLSKLLARLAEIPEAEVDVAEGWTPGFRPGDEVGRFVLQRELGRGGFGVVYEALDRDLGRSVAFKAIRPGRRRAELSESWLRGEAEAVARLNHPNIVTLHDFGTGPSGAYLIFELLRGQTLHDRLRAGPLPLREAVDLAVVLARVLAHAHQAGVVHRDLKPANVLLAEDGTVKVLDFGLAYLFGRAGPRYAGTPAYMAPEQWRSEPGDERIDLFALGVVLHHCINGELPYRVTRERSEALEPGPPPRLPTRAAPAALRALVARLLEKEPFARPRSAGEVLEVLLPIQRRLNRTGLGRLRWLALAAAAGVAVGVTAKMLMPPEVPGGDGQPLVVAVADFENHTGDPSLEALSGLLVTSLEQSRKFQVLTRSRLVALLRQAGLADARRIDEKIGREVARAAGARLLLVGSAQAIGGSYALELRAVEPERDRAVFTLSEEARVKDDIPGALDRLSVEARRALREGGDEIAARRIQLSETVTADLEAYRHYFQGTDCMDRPSQGSSWSSNLRCAEHFERALALDPTFALAHWQLAYILSTEGGPDFDRDAHMAAALRGIARTPPKEAALVRAWKAHLDAKSEEALALYDAVLGAYPGEKQALFLAGEIHFTRGDYGSAVPFFERALAVDPGAEWPLDYLVSALAAQRRRGELEALVARLQARPPTPATVHALVRGLLWLGDRERATSYARAAVEAGGGPAAEEDLSRVLFASGDFAAAEAVDRRRSDAAPGDQRAAFALATDLGAQGRVTEALHVLDRAAARSEGTALGPVQFARALLLAGPGLGDPAAARREASRAAALNPEFAGVLAVVLALRDDLPHAARLAAGIPASSPAARQYAALVEWRQGDLATAAAALGALEERDPAPAGRTAWPLLPAYLQAEVSAAAGDPRAVLAAVERYRALWPRGVWRSWATPRATLLAAAAHLRLGDRATARREVDALLRQLDRADADFAPLAEARALQRRLGAAP